MSGFLVIIPTLMTASLFSGGAMASVIHWDLYNATLGLKITRMDGTEDVCSGTLIRPNVVLTVAHCFVKAEKPTAIKIRASLDMKLSSDSLEHWEREVKRVILDPHYSDEKQLSDFALLILDRAFPSDLSFPQMNVFHEQGSNEFIRIGYGKRNQENRRTFLTTFLSRVNVDGAMKGFAVFNDIYGFPGDSGGPVFLKTTELQLVGLHTGRSVDAKGHYHDQSFMAPITSEVMTWISTTLANETSEHKLKQMHIMKSSEL